MSYIKEYWKDKEERAKIAQNHTKRCEKLYEKEISNSIRDTVIYDTGFTFDKLTVHHNTEIIVEDLDSVSAVMKYCTGREDINNRTAVLNFSSYKNPGGMFINGSKAQEECLCHESFLYNVLKEFQSEFYDWNNQHKNKALYLNRGMYTYNVLFFKGNDKKFCDVITCAAPNKSAAQKYQNVSDKENERVLRSRIRYVLDIAADNRVKTLILGAYGCGVFGQNPVEVAAIFKEYLYGYFNGMFEKVVFAVPKGKNNNLEAFKKIFEW